MIFPINPDLDPENQLEEVPEEYLEHSLSCKSLKNPNILLKICEEITKEQNIIDEDKININSKEQSRQKRKKNLKLHIGSGQWGWAHIRMNVSWKQVYGSQMAQGINYCVCFKNPRLAIMNGQFRWDMQYHKGTSKILDTGNPPATTIVG